MEQINKMAFALAELQTALDVYIGLFEEQSSADVMSKFEQISTAIRKSLSVNLIIGCAALFTDPDKSCGKTNMSFKNIYQKYESTLSHDAVALKTEIEEIVRNMNLKNFRDKFIGHYDLEEMLGEKSVTANINNNNLKELMTKGQQLLNLVLRDAKITPSDHYLAYYNPINKSRSTDIFVNCLRQIS